MHARSRSEARPFPAPSLGPWLIRAIIYLTHPPNLLHFGHGEQGHEPEPKSLQEAIVYFSNPDNCVDYLAIRRWPNGVICPDLRLRQGEVQSGSAHLAMQYPSRQAPILRQGRDRHGRFADPSGQVAHRTWLVTNCKNGISSYEIARDVKVTQKSAWFMLHRIRLAMQDDFFGSKLGGEVEVDETFIGGKARNMHLWSASARITGTGGQR